MKHLIVTIALLSSTLLASSCSHSSYRVPSMESVEAQPEGFTLALALAQTQAEIPAEEKAPVQPEIPAQPEASTPAPAQAPAEAPAQVPTQAPAPTQPQAQAPAPAQPPEQPAAPEPDAYRIGVDDILEIAVIQPEQIATASTVAPDGSVSFPYIGSVVVKGLTLEEAQLLIQRKLATGYMKYPIVSVSLKESRSRKFFIYGEVNRPGEYFVTDNMTVLRAITMAGGFNKFGSSSRVKVLRARSDSAGYDTLAVNVKALMSGRSTEDVVIKPGDIIVVSEGFF